MFEPHLEEIPLPHRLVEATGKNVLYGRELAKRGIHLNGEPLDAITVVKEYTTTQKVACWVLVHVLIVELDLVLMEQTEIVDAVLWLHQPLVLVVLLAVLRVVGDGRRTVLVVIKQLGEYLLPPIEVLLGCDHRRLAAEEGGGSVVGEGNFKLIVIESECCHSVLVL